ncbi:unnamed protein product [Blepharisma stoltei]|uniref:Peptidase S26 domain-containing protein n=1 Tax=Blepharisma stoltei TaxID=1481888 RepID=A0AAU9IFG3_9CILI|nr:unnamed protein product [Blepharisma stoltei]
MGKIKEVWLFLQAIACFRLAQYYLYDFRVAVGPSMLPTISDAGDVLLIDKLTPRIRSLKKGDVILAENPMKPNNQLCKRVICGPGEVAEVDGQEYLVPEGHIWIEGDNKSQSFDSRNFGPISIGLVEGKVAYKLWPKIEKL